MTDTLYWIIFAIPSILIASTIHEYAHGLIAYKLGDLTAKVNGRLTLNPLAHIDPIGALAMVFFKFGWSKPVPINENNFEHREIGSALTALAGPVSNFLTAGLTALIYKILQLQGSGPIEFLLYVFIVINLSLGIFNLIPIPPLDGHKIVRAILPKKLRYYWEKLENFSFIFILLLLLPFSPIGDITTSLISNTLSFLLKVLGF
jgi:Zn-dependent protease